MKSIRILCLALVLALTLCAADGCLGETTDKTIWSRGDTGGTVLTLQQRLIALGYLSGEPTRVFDEATEKAVLLFQRLNGLLETGMADPVTIELLLSDAAAPYTEVPWAREAEADVLYESGAYAPPAMAAPAIAATSVPAALTSNGAMGLRSYGRSTPQQFLPFSTDEYTLIGENGFQSVRVNPLSTFAADVDTASYAQLRRRVLGGMTVPRDSVRIEEMLNYFSYDYAAPSGDAPLGVTMELAPCPWNGQTLLLQIGLSASPAERDARQPWHLIFLIDTSGSMAGADRLDLVKRAFSLLLEELRPDDLISVVAYASMDRVLLEGVPAADKTRIMETIGELEPYGATNGTAGLLRAYEIAEKYMKPGAMTRILLATDGDLNVGASSEGELARLVQEKKRGGVSLTCLGFGMGNYKDNKMEALADYGDGNCWYIDTIHEARKALVTEGGGTFSTVAKDVKLQLDFNPARVKGYRLIGYEDRLLQAEDFADDRKDGGEIGSGHRVTALYELVPADSAFDFGEAQSRYVTPVSSESAEWLTLNIRYKAPGEEESRLLTYPLNADISPVLSDNMKLAASIAEAGMVLRGSEWAGESSYSSALALLRDCGAVSGDAYKEEWLYLLTLLERDETLTEAKR